MDDNMKKMTIMRLGELNCFDEEQRIAILDLVKTGAISVDEAFSEVKRVRPKSFIGLKYHGSAASPAATLKPSLTPQQGDQAITLAVARLKKVKERKVVLTVSTVGLRIADAVNEDAIENEPMVQIAYWAAVPGDKKKFAYVTSYSRLGLVYTHLFSVAKPKEAEDILAVISDRRKASLEQRSLVPATGVEKMSAGVDLDDEEDDGSTAILGAFHVTYLGNTPARDIQGDDVVAECVSQIQGDKKEKDKKKDKDTKEPTGTEKRDVPTVIVVSPEGIRLVEQQTHETIHSVVIKAISYSTEIIGKKQEMFAFIEVDDRRNSKTCHLFLTEKGASLKICETLSHGFQLAIEEARKRAGNPFHPQGTERDKVEGPLAERQIKRSDLRAIKIIGAGQFGKVFLALEGDGQVPRAVKMLRRGASEQDRQAFLSEADIMTTLGEHPNLVKFLGVAIKQRPWLVVLEFCQFGDLSDVLQACRRKNVVLSLKEKLKLCEQLASGMEYISSKKFVHMDLAARNCLMHVGSVLKVADFGLTHPFDEGQTHYKQVGVLKLSIRWLAIDSFDHKLFSEKSDVWSYGVTLWEIFTYGQQPFTGHKLTDVIRLVRGGARLPKPETCPQELYEVLEQCWIVDRNKRPTFKALRKTMGFFLEKESGDDRDIGSLLNAEFGSKIQRLSKRLSKPDGLVGAAGAGAAAGVVEDGLTGLMDDS